VADVVSLRRAEPAPPPATYAAAIDRYLAGAGISVGSARIYRIALTTWAWLLDGTQPPSGRARRGATAPEVDLAVLDHPATPTALTAAFAARLVAGTDPDTANRELSILRAALGWWRTQGWVHADPTLGLERRPAPADETRALTRDQVTAVLGLTSFRLPTDPPRRARRPVTLRERTWRLLYETAARAEEILGLDVDDLDLANKRARVVSKADRWLAAQNQRLAPDLGAGRPVLA
jgi:integrase/recombinase XerD